MNHSCEQFFHFVNSPGEDKKGFLIPLENEVAFYSISKNPEPFKITSDDTPEDHFPLSEMALKGYRRIPAFTGTAIFAAAKNFTPLGEPAPKPDPNRPPIVFQKGCWCVVDEQTELDFTRLRENGARIWAEGELAVVLDGNLRPKWATIANDITMHFPKIIQDNHLPYFKSQPNFLPLSSRVYPPDILNSFFLESVADGNVTRAARAESLIWNATDLTNWISNWAPLKENDLILLGSPLRFSGHVYQEQNSEFVTRLNSDVVMTTRFI